MFNVQLDQALSRKLRVSSVPSLVAINCGKLRWFSGQFTQGNLREFVRSQFPLDLIVEVSTMRNHFLLCLLLLH
jgi:hypothetical protein